MSRIRLAESLLPRISPPGPVLLQVQHSCLRAVVQLPRVTPEAHPPRTDPPTNLGRQVWGFSNGAFKIGEIGCLAVPLPRGVKTACVAGARGIGMQIVSVLLSEMVRPNAPKSSTNTATIRSNPRSDRDTMHASSAYSILHIARRAHSSAVSGPTSMDDCGDGKEISATMSASSLNL